MLKKYRKVRCADPETYREKTFYYGFALLPLFCHRLYLFPRVSLVKGDTHARFYSCDGSADLEPDLVFMNINWNGWRSLILGFVELHKTGDRQITGETVGAVKPVANMHQMKAEMGRQSDAFIALPGLCAISRFNHPQQKYTSAVGSSISIHGWSRVSLCMQAVMGPWRSFLKWSLGPSSGSMTNP